MAPKVFIANPGALSRAVTRTTAGLEQAHRAATVLGADAVWNAAESARAELISALGELCAGTGQNPEEYTAKVLADLRHSYVGIPGSYTPARASQPPEEQP